MKFFTLLAAASLAAVLSNAYATEMTNSDDEVFAYCNEQAERDGIENVDEKNQYVKEGVDSFAAQSGDNQGSGE